jgi:SHS2 domain-containing protein
MTFQPSEGDFHFLEEIAIADIAFEASGKTLEALFMASARATMEVMVDTRQVQPRVELPVELEAADCERLLFRWLEEIIFQKDAHSLLFNEFHLTLSQGQGCSLKAILRGEEIDPKRHELRCDVKAVTLHLFELCQTPEGWRARVILDI